MKGQLKGLCQVQHAPFAKGSGAVDSRYGLQCLSMMLSTTSLEPTHYDAVVFNFGMHDIDYSKLFPEVCRYYFIQLFLCSFRFILQIFFSLMKLSSNNLLEVC